MKKVLALTTASGLALAGLVLAAPAAQAKGDQIKQRGMCGASTASYVVKIKNKKGQLRADFWVKTDTVGQTWNFTLTGPNVNLGPISKSTVSSDDRSRGISRISLRDRGLDDDMEDVDDDSVTGIDDSDDDYDDDGVLHDANDDSRTGVDDSDDDSQGEDSDDDGALHDADDDSQGDDSSSSSSSTRSSSHVAEVKFRNWIPTGAGTLVFNATTDGGPTCMVSVQMPQS